MANRKCTRYSMYWEETECLSYYEMLSLHEIFDIVGSQLTESDIEVLSFLLDETYPGKHPLSPDGWTEELPPGPDGNPQSYPPCPRLLKSWRRIQPQNGACPVASRHRPKSGVELLLELERRGYISEGNLEALFQLLRILTRHDVLPFVSQKKRRTVSPERERIDYPEVETRENAQICSNAEISYLENTQDQHWRTGAGASATVTTPPRRRRGKGRRWSRKSRDKPEIQPQPTPEKVTCGVEGDSVVVQMLWERFGAGELYLPFYGFVSCVTRLQVLFDLFEAETSTEVKDRGINAWLLRLLAV